MPGPEPHTGPGFFVRIISVFRLDRRIGIDGIRSTVAAYQSERDKIMATTWCRNRLYFNGIKVRLAMLH